MADDAYSIPPGYQHQQFHVNPSTPLDYPSAPSSFNDDHLSKLEASDDLLVLPDPAMQLPAPRNFRSKKRNRVMQSCVACHAQKRKCDRKRPCTRCTEHGIAGQCVYQLEDPAVRDASEQDELRRLRTRVAELERTVRVLMQKPLSKRAAAALEVETDALLGTSSQRKRKIATTDPKHGGDGDRATKQLKPTPHVALGDDNPEWLPFHEPSIASPMDALSPFAHTPGDSHYHHFNPFGDIPSPSDVPTPPYSTFPTPSSDAGSPFKRPYDPIQRRFSDGSALANMMSHTQMMPHSPESLSPTSPASIASYAAGNGSRSQAPTACGCGMNPIGSEVLTNLQTQLEASFDVVKTLPEHSHNLPCNVIFSMADLIDAIQAATSGTSAPAITATASPPELPSAPSSTHTSPLPENGVSPVSTIATPPNYMLQPPASHLPHNPPSFHHSDVPTVSGFTSLSSWAAFTGSTSFLDTYQPHGVNDAPHFNGMSASSPSHAHSPHHMHGMHGHGTAPLPQMVQGYSQHR